VAEQSGLLDEEVAMRCVICASQDIVRRPVEGELRLGNDVVLLPIEVLVCLNCGERYYDCRTSRLLEEIRDPG